MPLSASLEREQWTLQRLNSSGDESEVSERTAGSHSPASAWSTDSIDDDFFLDYLFSSSGLGDTMADPRSPGGSSDASSVAKYDADKMALVAEFCDSLLSTNFSEEKTSSAHSGDIITEDFLDDIMLDEDIFSMDKDQDLVVLGVGLNHLMQQPQGQSEKSRSLQIQQQQQEQASLQEQEP